jgi:Na+/H+-dicarboxylate symporter
MLKKLPIILLIVMAISAMTQQYIPYDVKSGIFALSLTIKSILIFSLPLLIFLLIFKTASQLAKGASKVILLILSLVILSNFCSTFLSFGVGSLLYKCDFSLSMPQQQKELEPLWTISLPSLISNSLALVIGAVLGVISSIADKAWVHHFRSLSEKVVSWLLKFFMLIIPIFVTGFIIKLAHDEILTTILKEYASIFLIVGASQIIYIFFLYFLSNQFKLSLALSSLKNILPAAFVGFGAMSSAAAMPLTLIGAKKNARHEDISQSCIPATVNIHLIGDCLAIPIFAFAVLKNFHVPEPRIFTYTLFAAFFVMAKFSVAAIPGGGIIVMLPVLESYLGFTPEMLSLITALYILFDPVITFSNVLGNGAFAQVVDKIYNKIFQTKPEIVSR